MSDNDLFWTLDGLSDEQVLAGLRRTLGSSRRVTAELVAHIGEVEERRLHLAAACSSMFSYCVSRLGLSEDEACRRIEVARLARRFPAIFPLLATGELSLSVAALLKPHLASNNADRLILAVAGKSVRLARETLVAWFPRPDAPGTLRKLPERRRQSSQETCATQLLTPGNWQVAPSAEPSQFDGAAAASSMKSGLSTASVVSVMAPPPAIVTVASNQGLMERHSTEVQAPVCSVEQPAIQPRAAAAPVPGETPLPRVAPRVLPRSLSIEPLAAARYKVQFTADADLKAKLQLARDLMRHAIPSGDLAAIVSAALDRLVADVVKQRFGARKETHKASASPAASSKTASSKTASTQTAGSDMSGRGQASQGDDPSADVAATPAVESASAAYIPRAVRRTVVERDGMRCTWVDARGTRCEERAWLEYDHRHPCGKGGHSDADNVRLLCRSHNRYSAELEYGHSHVERSIALARRRRAAPPGAQQVAEAVQLTVRVAPPS